MKETPRLEGNTDPEAGSPGRRAGAHSSAVTGEPAAREASGVTRSIFWGTPPPESCHRAVLVPSLMQHQEAASWRGWSAQRPREDEPRPPDVTAPHPGQDRREGSRGPRGPHLLQLPHPQAPPHVLGWETPCLLSSLPERPPPEGREAESSSISQARGPGHPAGLQGFWHQAPGPRCGPARLASPAAGPPRGERRPPWGSRAGPEGPSVQTATSEPRGGRDRGQHRSVHTGGRHPAGWVATGPGTGGRPHGPEGGNRQRRQGPAHGLRSAGLEAAPDTPQADCAPDSRVGASPPDLSVTVCGAGLPTGEVLRVDPTPGGLRRGT